MKYKGQSIFILGLVITDDTEAKRLLDDAGQFDLATCGNGQTTQLIFRHEGYRWLSTFHHGYEKPEDNGHIIVGFPDTPNFAEIAAEFFNASIASEHLMGTLLHPGEVNTLTGFTVG